MGKANDVLNSPIAMRMGVRSCAQLPIDISAMKGFLLTIEL